MLHCSRSPPLQRSSGSLQETTTCYITAKRLETHLRTKYSPLDCCLFPFCPNLLINLLFDHLPLSLVRLLTEDQTNKIQHCRMVSILFDPAELLYTCAQDGRLIEEYVEEFIRLSFLVPWSDSALKTLFWLGLNDNLVGQVHPVTNSYCLVSILTVLCCCVIPPSRLGMWMKP